MSSFVGALDQGTSSSRFVLYDAATLAPVSSFQTPLQTLAPRPGWLEQEPRAILESVQRCIEKALAAAHVQASAVRCVGITNQRETAVLWDDRTGEALCNALLWSDTRNASLCTALSGLVGGPDGLRSLTGLPVSTYFSATKVAWMLQNEPRALEAARQGHCLFGTVDSWLLWNMTGAHVTDVTNASRTQLMDLRTQQWSSEVLQRVCALEPAVALVKLPRIVDSTGSEFGVIRAGPLRGVPVTGALGDQQAALLGQGCVSTGQLKATYGTGVFALLHTGDQALASRHGLLTTVAFRGGDAPVQYALEGSVASAGSVVTWLRDGLGLITSYAALDEVADSVPDTGGVTFVPCLGGLLAPHWRPDARGTLLGLTQHTSRGHIVRAALEGVALQTTDVIEALRADAKPLEVRELKVDGGLAASRVLLQLQANSSGARVLVRPDAEATALGAARAAGIGAGLWNYADAALLNSGGSHGWTSYAPELSDPERQAALQRWRAAVQRALPLE